MCVVVRDRREKRPLAIEGFAVEVTHLPVGDYGVKGFSDAENPRFIVERKSLSDLVVSLNAVERGKSRFLRQIERMRCFQKRILLIEASRGEVELGAYSSRTAAHSILGRVDAICHAAGIEVFWCENPRGAAQRLESLVRRFVESMACQGQPDEKTP